MGQACALAARRQGEDRVRLQGLSDRLFAKLKEEVPDVHRNGSLEHRLPHTLNVSFPGLWGGAVLERTPGVAASTGAACHAGVPEPSLTLKAIGAPREVGIGAIRFSLGHATTAGEIDAAAQQVGATVRALRSGRT
jgi:cysteine desulfurase